MIFIEYVKIHVSEPTCAFSIDIYFLKKSTDNGWDTDSLMEK